MLPSVLFALRMVALFLQTVGLTAVVVGATHRRSESTGAHRVARGQHMPSRLGTVARPCQAGCRANWIGKNPNPIVLPRTAGDPFPEQGRCRPTGAGVSGRRVCTYPAMAGCCRRVAGRLDRATYGRYDVCNRCRRGTDRARGPLGPRSAGLDAVAGRIAVGRPGGGLLVDICANGRGDQGLLAWLWRCRSVAGKRTCRAKRSRRGL